MSERFELDDFSTLPEHLRVLFQQALIRQTFDEGLEELVTEDLRILQTYLVGLLEIFKSRSMEEQLKRGVEYRGLVSLKNQLDETLRAFTDAERDYASQAVEDSAGFFMTVAFLALQQGDDNN